jgi:A/G-specific adenine glycosylase
MSSRANARDLLASAAVEREQMPRAGACPENGKQRHDDQSGFLAPLGMTIRSGVGPRNDGGKIRAKLLSWYRQQKRQLPWRATSDAYRIWVSEVMLAQTTVAAVESRYEQFLRRFPDLLALARAREDSVLAAWSGLGYYERARNLRRAARAVVREHGGVLPQDPELLGRLPGFGPYTAAAVASLAFGRRVPAADANVTRVVSRLFALEGRPGSRAHSDEVLARVRGLLPRGRPGDAIAALMDLGQSICLPRRPDCTRCPLFAECAAARRGKPESYPARAGKPRPVTVHFAAAVAQGEGRAFLIRRRASFLNGLWEFPSAEGETPALALRNLAAALRPLGLTLTSRRPAGRARHTVVNRRLLISIFPAVVRLPPSAFRLPPPAPSRWFRPADLGRAAVPTLTRKIANAVGFLPLPLS